MPITAMGLANFAVPIVVSGYKMGCFICGQMLTEAPDEEIIRKLAQDIGVDSRKLTEAVRKVDIVREEDIKSKINALSNIANIVFGIAFNKHQLNVKNQELLKSSNMKSDFLANMSHEIRTPMNAIIGMAEMALREDLPTLAREYVGQIKASGQTLLTIINDILDFSKIESGMMAINKTEYEPMSVVNDVANIIMTRIGSKELELTVDVDPNIPSKLRGDNIRIKQVIINLANNAVKFTKMGNVHLQIGYRPKGRVSWTSSLRYPIPEAASGSVTETNSSSPSSSWTASAIGTSREAVWDWRSVNSWFLSCMARSGWKVSTAREALSPLSFPRIL